MHALHMGTRCTPVQKCMHVGLQQQTLPSLAIAKGDWRYERVFDVLTMTHWQVAAASMDSDAQRCTYTPQS
jgi:hypothetical protein